jgi:DivIVA domain-containing protein
MSLTPSQISAATFRTVRKGYDPEEVAAFLGQAASALEQAQQHATAMEARARAAVLRLQEAQEGTSPAPTAQREPEPVVAAPAEPAAAQGMRVSADEAETISRTLLLAQRSADMALAEAEAAAEKIRLAAEAEAHETLDSTRTMSARLMEEAREAARKSTAAERRAAENEVESLKARREFLVGDVNQLETFLIDQRERLRGAARQIEALCDRVPSGLGSVPTPALSASDDEPADDPHELFVPPEIDLEFASAEEIADALGDDGSDSLREDIVVDDDDLDPTQAFEWTTDPLPVREVDGDDAR